MFNLAAKVRLIFSLIQVLPALVISSMKIAFRVDDRIRFPKQLFTTTENQFPESSVWALCEMVFNEQIFSVFNQNKSILKEY